MSRWIVSLSLLGLLSCASSGPPAPPLAHPIVWVQKDFEEKGGILAVVGTLTLTVSPEGEGESTLKRQLFTDVDRRSWLTNEERWELRTRIEAWVASAGKPEAPSPKSHGTLTYGELKVGWEKGASLSPELTALLDYLKQVTFSLSVVRKRG